MNELHLRKAEYNLFPFAFAVWFIAEILFNTTLDEILPFNLEMISGITDCSIFLLLLIQIFLFQEYSPWELIVIVLITIPVAVSTLLSGSVRIMGTWMFLVSFRNTSLDDIVAMTYRILRIMIPAVIFLCLTGLLPDASSYRFDVLRHSMGFNHPNYFGMKIFQFSSCHIYLHWNSLKGRDVIWAVLIIAFLYLVPHSVTSILCTTALFLLTFAGRLLEDHSKPLLNVCKNGLMVSSFLFIATAVLITLYGMRSPLWQALDAWMSRRLSYANRIFLIYGISLLGQKVSSSYLLDSGYMDLILRSGLFVFILFFFSYMWNMAVHKKDTALYILLCTFAFYGIMEYGVYLIARNIFLLSFADILYAGKRAGRT